MPLQNRVTPFGDIVAEPGRGLVFGNRGCLHDEQRRIRRRHNGRRWIACRLQFRGRHHDVLMQPGHYTELFLLDDATALAAGHRPCAECRREDWTAFLATWRGLHDAGAGADAIDARLHGERLDAGTRSQRRHRAAFDDLPDGAYVFHEDAPRVVARGRLHAWSAGGYTGSVPRPPRGEAVLLTPPSLVAVLRAGWMPELPLLHPTAR